MRNLTRECKGSLPMGRFRTSSTCTEIWLQAKKRWRGKDVRILLPGKISREAMHPYYDDLQARKTFGNAEHLAQKEKIQRRFIYRQQEPEVLEQIWQVIHPRDIVISPENASLFKEINPDRIRYEVVPGGNIAHFLKSW